MTQKLRIAVDIGGTFTDAVLVAGDDDVLATAKTLTTHEDPTDGALEAVNLTIADADVSMSDVTGFIHGTTLATNALIERRGARVASITTEGFRDILEIAYERRYSQYDINLEKPDLIVPRARSFTVPERLSVRGEVLAALDETAVDGLVSDLKSCTAEAVAICLLHSYANPDHEQRLRRLLLERMPDLAVSLSCEVSPEAREFDRLCTTIANAYVQPLMSNYLTSFAETFAAEGLTCPVLMMTASGGMTTLQTATRFPIRLVESGPAGGAILAAQVAERAGASNVLSFDMGGTTAKLCLIDNYEPQTSRSFEISRADRFIKGSGMPVRIPVIEMIEIGAGGGSIASVDALGRLAVGPQSAGSEPGPAAFGRGGSEPTVTDADVVLGLIEPARFAEGRLEVDEDAARGVLEEKAGKELSLDARGSAVGISDIVDENMANAARMHAVESGKDLGARTMIAFGGNGPLHATRVARRAGVTDIIIPNDPGVGSAVGFLGAPISFEIVRSLYATLINFDADAVNQLFNGLIADAAEVVGQAAPRAETLCQRKAFMRYSGQGHEIEIGIPDRDLVGGDVGRMTADFEAEYSRQFSRAVPGMVIEILNWSVRVSTVQEPAVPLQKVSTIRDANSEATRSIVCDVTGNAVKAGLYDRGSLSPGDRITGPALITEAQTTTLVSVDYAALVNVDGSLLLSAVNPGEKQS